jgi:carnitine-CoA ligase
MTTNERFFRSSDSIPQLVERCAVERPEYVYCRVADVAVTCADLHARIERAARALHARGVRPGMHVAVMLGHHLAHIVTFFALMRLRAVQVPVNVHLRGAGLADVIQHSEATVLVAEDAFRDVLESMREANPTLDVIWHRGDHTDADDLARLLTKEAPGLPFIAPDDADVRAIIYTSGTTGPAKGVVMTDRMYRAAALGSTWIGDIRPGSVLHFWDPMYHVFGAEVLVLALMVPVTLAMVPKFSASRLWDEARAAGATHLHFVGGVLQLLLKQPSSSRDREHGVRVAWGGGCPVDVWRQFEERFGVCIHEGYGMTETSSFSIINRDGRVGSIGTAVPYFDVEVVDDAGNSMPPGTPGEIRVAAREDGVLMREYFRNPEATARTIRDGWLYTGDIGYRDDDCYFYFLRRKKDSLRRRGENVSAWEVERVINEHPAVEECALVGVKDELGDEELKLFVKPRNDTIEPDEIVRWCEPRLAGFQIPRFIAFVNEFAKTPTQRIQKQFLSRSTNDCWDRARTEAWQ